MFTDKSPSAGEADAHWLAALSRALVQHWFGGLVTPSWWDNAWLSEGFATFFQLDAVAKVWRVLLVTYLT